MSSEKELNPAVWGRAAAEIRDFVGQFKAIQVALEEVGGLERRVSVLRQQEASILAARVKAEADAVAAVETRVSGLKQEEANLTAALPRLREQVAEAQEALAVVTESLAAKEKAHAEIVTHVERLRAKLG